MTDDFQRYLRAKRTVDDRALDRRLVELLREALAARAAASDGPLNVLEVGSGIGTMVERAVEWDLLPPGETRYTAVDINAANTQATADQLAAFEREGWTATVTDGTVRLSGPTRTVRVDPVTADAAAFAGDSDRSWDLLVGMALLDVLGLDTLPSVLDALGAGGLYYFPISFDGGTRFRPAHPADDAVESHYHAHMDAKPGGDSRAGSHALDRLRANPDVTVLGAAGSDWVVRPRGGSYPAEEAYFLRFVLDTVERALSELDRGPALPDATLADWLSARRQAVTDGRLTYLTHQLDLLGRVDPG